VTRETARVDAFSDGVFDLLERVDRRVLHANGPLLLLMTFVPFATARRAACPDHAGANVASAFDGATCVAINVADNLLWFTAARNHRLIRPDVPDEVLLRIRRASLLGFPVYLLAVGVALRHALLGVVLGSALWIFRSGLDDRVRHPLPARP